MNDFLEKTLEDIIYDHKEIIHERGFSKFYKNTERQFRLPNGQIIDLFTFEIMDDILYFKIIELKRLELNLSSIWQIYSYFQFIWEQCVNRYKDVKYELILAGRTADI